MITTMLFQGEKGDLPMGRGKKGSIQNVKQLLKELWVIVFFKFLIVFFLSLLAQFI